MGPPLALDIDGTLTTEHGRIDPRVFETLPAWDAPVVLATGKAFPYPVSLCHFLGIPETVIAENGGVVCAEGTVTFTGDRDRAREAADEFEDRGGDLGWDGANLANRWRETEIIARVGVKESLLREVAEEYDMEVVDTGYAYHIKTPGVEKGDGLVAIADLVGLSPADFVAVGDSVNDASLFEAAGESYAVANADETAKAAADVVVEEAYFDGTLSVLDSL